MEGSRTPKRQILGEINNLAYLDSSPLSPTANLKLLTKVATNVSNLCVYDERTCEAKETPQCSTELQIDENQKSRKEKSLNLLCNKFLQLYPLNLNEGNHMIISLDEVACKLGTERRRIYDIINVLESLQMAIKAGKNQYIWYGSQYLNLTLSQLKGLALRFGFKEKVQSLQLKQTPVQFHVIPNVCKSENIFNSENDSSELNFSSQTLNCIDRTNVQLSSCRIETQTSTFKSEKIEDIDTKVADIKTNEGNLDDSSGQSGACLCKDERSLGVLCQKFIMLFLIADKSDLINLDVAAKILLNENSWEVLKNKGKNGSEQDKLSGASSESDTKRSLDSQDSTESGDGKVGKFKTKARRLYDIANVLTSLNLICKVRNAGSTRKPAFKYTGPNVEAASFSDKDMLLLQTTRQSLLGSSCLNLKFGCGLACMKIMGTDKAEEEIQIRRVCNNQGPRKKKSSLIPSSEEGSSLSKILKVAEMELQRLESAKTPDKEQSVLNSVKAEVKARKKLFASHDCETKAGQKKCVENKASFDDSRKDDIGTTSAEVVAADRIKKKNKAPILTELKTGKGIRITRKLVKVSPIKIHNVAVLPKLNPLVLSNLPQQQSTETSVKQVLRLPKDMPIYANINGIRSANPATDKKQSAIKYKLAEPIKLARLPVCTKSLNNVPILFISNPDILIGKSLVSKGRCFTLQNSNSKTDNSSVVAEQPAIDSNLHLVPVCNNTFNLK